MGFLAINMSGSSFPVWDTNYAQIGRIYPKERFAVISKGTAETKINFRNSAGQWVAGFCEASGSAMSDWCNYRFSNGKFAIDRKIDMYDSNAKFVKSYTNVGVQPFSGESAQNGTTRTDFMRIVSLWDSNGPLPDNTYGMFIDCKIRENSMDTPVYGNWN